MIKELDYFQRQELPTLILCKPDRTPVASLKGCSSVENKLRFNDISELEFTFPRLLDGSGSELPAYNLLKNKMWVLVKDIGYYIITECEIAVDKGAPVKKVSCQSAEESLLHRRITGFTGTFGLHDIDNLDENPGASLLNILLQYFPSWNIGYVDPDIATKYRTFEVDNSTLYNFLREDVELAYNCVVRFDTLAMTISVYSIPNIYDNIGAYLSPNNINLDIDLSEFSDELTTALYCYGDEIDINSVNPLGSNAIYDFSYFKTTEWMSQELIDALDAWENKVLSYEDTFSQYAQEFLEKSQELAELDTELTSLKINLTAHNETYRIMRAQKLPGQAAQLDLIEDTQAELGETAKEVALKKIEVDSVYLEQKRITKQLGFTRKLNLKSILKDLSTANDSVFSNFSTVSSQWSGVYNGNSTALEFNYDYFTEVYPTIDETFSSTATALDTIISTVSDKLENYDSGYDTNDIAEIKETMNSFFELIQSLFDLFTQVVPNTTITILLNSIMMKMRALYDIIDYDENFTEEQYLELQNFIFDNTYVNEYITVLETGTVAQEQEQVQALYDLGREVLLRVSQPRYEISGNFTNVFATPDFRDFVENIELGKAVTIEVESGKIVEATLLELSFEYDRPDNFDMVFGNRVKLNGSSYQFADLFINAADAGTTVTGI